MSLGLRGVYVSRYADFVRYYWLVKKTLRVFDGINHAEHTPK